MLRRFDARDTRPVVAPSLPSSLHTNSVDAVIKKTVMRVTSFGLVNPLKRRPPSLTRSLARAAPPQRAKTKPTPSTARRPIELAPFVSAEKLAKELNVSIGSLRKRADALGEPLPENSTPLASDIVELLALEWNRTVQLRDVDAHAAPKPSADEAASLPVRPPTVTLMGHVDHGKTSLLDAFRGSRLVDGEAGGITQGISAFVVNGDTTQPVTFIDTPGHELFSRMRARGAHATDVLLVVVAIDAGVQATTREAIRYAQEAKLPIVVAANKVDRPGAREQLPKLKQELLSNGLELEEFGGDVPVVEVSATQGIGLDDLLEAIQLQAELLELRAPTDGPAEGLVLDCNVHRGLGNVATVLIQRGVLRPRDHVIVGDTWGRARMLQNEMGKGMASATAGTPVRLTGLRDQPRPGDELLVVQSEARAKEVHDFRKARAAHAEAAALTQRRGRRVSKVKPMPMMLKADTQGGLEAAHDSLQHFPTNRVELQIVRTAVGPVTESDVQVASKLEASITAFGVDISGGASDVAKRLGVRVQAHSVIYELVDDVKDMLEKAIPPVVEERVLGTAEVLDTFTLTLNRKGRSDGIGKRPVVAGSKVSTGVVSTNALARLKRGSTVVYEGKVASLRHFKEEVRSLKAGAECGIILHSCASSVLAGDVIEVYEMAERHQSLYEEESVGEAASQAAPSFV